LGFQTQEFGAAGLLRQFIDHLYHMENPGVDGRTILRWIFRKWDGRPWTKFIWLQTGTKGGDL
jgi:hypothetical protein